MEALMKVSFKQICYRLLSVVVIMIATLTFAGCSVSFAWFTSNDEDSVDVDGAVASVEIYSNGQLISGSDNGTPDDPVDDKKGFPYQVSISSLGQISGTGKGLISFKNTSNVTMLLSVRQFVISYHEEFPDNPGNDVVVTNSEIDLNLSGEWIAQSNDEILSDPIYYTYNYFYNNKIAPGEEITFIPNLTVTGSSLIGQTITINILVEVIAYFNNAYKTNTSPRPWSLDDPHPVEGWVAYL